MMLSSSWTASDGFNLNDGVEVCCEVPTLLQDLLLENKSFVLVPEAQHRSLPCSLTLQTAPCGISKNVIPLPSKVITSITLVSEARLVEVFVGDHEEYLKSFSGQVIQSFPDSIVCRTDIHLLKPKKNVKLLLRNLFDAASVMVYGVFAKVAELGSESLDCSGFPRFSSLHLNALLADRSLNLSENALALKRLVEQYNDNIDNNAAASIGNIMPLLGMSMACTQISMKSMQGNGAIACPNIDTQNNIGDSPSVGCGEQYDPLRENRHKEKDLVDHNNVGDSNVVKGHSSCQRLSEASCHEVQKTNTNVEGLSNTLKNQLNLNLNSSLNPESAQQLSLFLKENKYNIVDLFRSASSSAEVIQTNHGHTQAKAHVPCVTTQPIVTQFLHPRSIDSLSADPPSINTPSIDIPSVDTSSVDTLSVHTSSVDTPSVHTSVDTPFVDTLSIHTPFVETSKHTPSIDTRSVHTPFVDTSKQTPPGGAAAPPCAQLPSITVCQSGSTCHHLEKVMDEKLEKFEARMESLINRKLDECVAKILNALHLSSPEEPSLGRV